MQVDRNGLEVLTRAECFGLLRTARVGRVGLSISALPVVLPVNYALMDDTIVVRSGPGTKLDAALAGSVVAFEVDHTDDSDETGWSVLVQGVASVITGPDGLKDVIALGLRPWAGGSVVDRFVRISSEAVSGRRIVHPDRDASFVAPTGPARDTGMRR